MPAVTLMTGVAAVSSPRSTLMMVILPTKGSAMVLIPEPRMRLRSRDFFFEIVTVNVGSVNCGALCRGGHKRNEGIEQGYYAGP